MPNEVFWGITPRMVSALFDRYREGQRAADRRAGEIAARAMMAGANFNWKKYPNGATWTDVFPEWDEPKPAPVQTKDQVFANAMLWVEATKRRAKSA